MWVLRTLARYCPDVLYSELDISVSWINSHISDHCGYHYRAMLIRTQLQLPFHLQRSRGGGENGQHVRVMVDTHVEQVRSSCILQYFLYCLRRSKFVDV